jgi:hypothetical protein
MHYLCAEMIHLYDKRRLEIRILACDDRLPQLSVNFFVGDRQENRTEGVTPPRFMSGPAPGSQTQTKA